MGPIVAEATRNRYHRDGNDDPTDTHTEKSLSPLPVSPYPRNTVHPEHYKYGEIELPTTGFSVRRRHAD